MNTGYIGPGEYLKGDWDAYDDESDISFTEYCIGTTVGGCQVRDMQRVPDNQTSVTCSECKLKHKHAYFMTIRVWNKAGLFSLATTDGLMADLTPPTSGQVTLKPTYMPCMGTCTLLATFSGFIDEESGIKYCEFSVEVTNGTIISSVQTTTAKSRIQTSNLTLTHGTSYTIVVSCVNSLGERSMHVHSTPVTIDNTPPEKVWLTLKIVNMSKSESVTLEKNFKKLETKLITFREIFSTFDRKMNFSLTTSASTSVFSDHLVIIPMVIIVSGSDHSQSKFKYRQTTSA